MRMTKRKKELLRLYQRERARGFQAQWALSNARTRLEWDKHEVAEYSSGKPIDPQRGNVRLRLVPDETCSLEDLEGDCFNPKANPDIPASRLERDRKEFMEKVNGEGCLGNHRRILRRRGLATRGLLLRIRRRRLEKLRLRHRHHVGDARRSEGCPCLPLLWTADSSWKRRIEQLKKQPDKLLIESMLLPTLREELEALRFWQQEPELTDDLANGIAISISKIETAICAAERNKS